MPANPPIVFSQPNVPTGRMIISGGAPETANGIYESYGLAFGKPSYSFGSNYLAWYTTEGGHWRLSPSPLSGGWGAKSFSQVATPDLATGWIRTDNSAPVPGLSITAEGGASPAAPGTVFTPPGAGAPTAPAAVHTQPGAGQSLVITGALAYDGTPVVFPPLVLAGTVNGKPQYTDTGATGLAPYSCTWAVDNSGWYLGTSPDAAWFSSSAVATPDLATGWAPIAPATGTPQVTLSGGAPAAPPAIFIP